MRAKVYLKFSGILIGCSISIAVIIIGLANERMISSPFYNYSLAFFIYSALAFFNTYTAYGRVSENSSKTDFYFLYGTFFYYTGYWSLLLGLIYLTAQISFSQPINFPLYVSLLFLGITFVWNIYEFLWEIIKGRKLVRKLAGVMMLVFLIMFTFIFNIPLQQIIF